MQRQERLVDPQYLKWLMRQRCACCGAPPPCDPAHLRAGSLKYAKPYPGLRRKPDDRWALPLKRKCHMSQTFQFGELQFWQLHGVADPFALCIKYYKCFGGDGGKPLRRKARRKIPSRPFPKSHRKLRSKTQWDC
jgi:hypothetical protein